METLYIGSLEARAGKSLLAAALGRRLAAQGRRVGYWKTPSPEQDLDGAMVRHTMGLDEAEVTATLEEAGRGRDVLLVEGKKGGIEGEVVEEAGARVLLVLWYTESLDVEAAARGVEAIQERLAGVVVNGVPPLRLPHARDELVGQLEERGLRVVGLLPQDRLLRAPTVREMAEHLGGRFVFSPDKADELVEHIMIGALALDGGLYYFGQQEKKLVITRWDRPDMQNAALETSVMAFILTGGEGPIPYMQARMEENQVPVVVVQEGTIATATRLDGFFSRGRLHPLKVERAMDLLGEQAGLEGILSG